MLSVRFYYKDNLGLVELYDCSSSSSSINNFSKKLELIGKCGFHTRDNTVKIGPLHQEILYVSENYRNKGYSKIILDQLISFVKVLYKKSEYSEIEIIANTGKSNIPAQKSLEYISMEKIRENELSVFYKRVLKV